LDELDNPIHPIRHFFILEMAIVPKGRSFDYKLPTAF